MLLRVRVGQLYLPHTVRLSRRAYGIASADVSPQRRDMLLPTAYAFTRHFSGDKCAVSSSSCMESQ